MIVGCNLAGVIVWRLPQPPAPPALFALVALCWALTAAFGWLALRFAPRGSQTVCRIVCHARLQALILPLWLGFFYCGAHLLTVFLPRLPLWTGALVSMAGYLLVISPALRGMGWQGVRRNLLVLAGGVALGTVLLGALRSLWGLEYSLPAAAFILWAAAAALCLLLLVLPPAPQRVGRLAERLFGDEDGLTIFTVSLAAALLLALIFPAALLPDSLDYYRQARNIAAQSAEWLRYRPPGYPLLLVLSGAAAARGRFTGILLLQGLLAVLMPVLIYRTLRPIHPAAARLAGWLSILSLVPYGYMQAILTETPYAFLTLLAAGCAVRCVYTQQAWRFGVFIAALLGMMLLKPAANLLALPLLAVMLFYRPAGVRRYVGGLAAVIALSLLLQHAHSLLAGWHLPRPTPDTGKYLFINVYFSSGGTPRCALRPENGPATAQLAALVKDYLQQNPEAHARYQDFPNGDYFFGRYRNRPAELADAMLCDPSIQYLWALWQITADALPQADNDRLYAQVSLESLRICPQMGAQFLLRNLRAYFIGPPLDYSYSPDLRQRLVATRYGFPLTWGTPAALLEAIPPAAADVFTQSYTPLRSYGDRLLELWAGYFAVLRPLVFGLALIGTLLAARQRQYRPLLWVCALTIAYAAGVVCLFSFPSDRYMYVTFQVELLPAALGVAALLPRRFSATADRLGGFDI